MTQLRFSDAALEDLKSRNPCNTIARKWVRLRKHGASEIGPCPFCSPDSESKDGTRFEVWPDRFACANCCEGGDVIKLVQLYQQIDFIAAIAWLGGVQYIDPAEAKRRDEERARLRAQRDREANTYREKERRSLYDMWVRAIEGPSIVDEYLAIRRLTRPPKARLRAIAELPYWDKPPPHGKIIHRGPAMVAAIVGNDGRFSGLHFTWIDLAQPKGKARILDPKTGDVLKSKKMRGTKTAGRIELVAHPQPAQVIMGEGIEKVAAIWQALAELGRDLSSTAFWSTCDLGNLGGKSDETVPHPTLRGAGGRVQKVGGPVPDLEAPAIAVPDSVEDLVLLGDSTSDRFSTQCAIARAGARYARPGRQVRAAWAPEGLDFDEIE